MGLEMNLRVLVAIALFLMACGSGDDRATSGSNVPNIGEPSFEGNIEETTTTIPGIPFVTSQRMEMDVEADEGSKYHLVLEIGELRRYDGLEPIDGFAPPYGCPYDVGRDAIIPVRIGATSRTSEFSIDMGGSLYLETASNVSVYDEIVEPMETVTIEGDNTYSDGATCNGTGDLGVGVVVSGVAFTDATSGELRSHSFYVAVHDYYSPEFPQGKEAVLSEIGLFFRLQGDFSFDDVSNVCGTGVLDRGISDLQGYVAVLPFVRENAYIEIQAPDC